MGYITDCDIHKKGKRKIQGVPQSQTAALPRSHNPRFFLKRRILMNTALHWDECHVTSFTNAGERSVDYLFPSSSKGLFSDRKKHVM